MWRFDSGRSRARAAVPLGVLVAAIVGGAGGCSFMFVDGPPPKSESMRYFDCTSTRIYPALDLVLAGVAVPATISAATDGSQGSTSASIAGAVVAGAALASAAHGFVVTGHCLEAKRALAARALAPPTTSAPAPFVEPWPGPAGTAGWQVDPWLAAGPPPFPLPGTGPPTGPAAPAAFPPTPEPAPEPAP